MTVVGWPRAPIGRIASPRLGGNYRNSASLSGRPLIKMGNIARVSINLSRLDFIPDSEVVDPAHRLRFGDVLLNTRNTLDLVGKVSIWRDDLPVAYYNSNILRLEFKPESCGDSRFFGYALNSWESINAIRALATGTTSVAAIYTRDLLKMEVPTPPKPEQRAIAAALDDADHLIAKLELLIVKRQAIKQGMMQQLLTGRSRLPGFAGDWTRLAVASKSLIKARIGWQGLKTDEYRDSGLYRLVGGTEIVEGRVEWDRTPFVDKWRYEQDAYIQLHDGDVLLTKDGSIGKIAYVDRLPGPATLNSGVFVIRPIKGAYEPQFLYFMLRSRAFEKFLARLSAGSTISHLYQRDLVTLSLEVPPTLEEQRAIAAVLADAELEIELLRRRLTKVREIRTGMMQQLLTGRARLPVETRS